MTDLLDRIKHRGMNISLESIDVHHFSSALALAALATTGAPNRQNIIDEWTLVGDEIVQLDALIAVYVNKSNANQKQNYIQVIINGFMVYETQIINKAQLETLLEI